MGTTQAIENAFIIIVLHSSASYFNNYFLIPNLLHFRKYFQYFLSVILTISFVCFIHIVFLLWADTIENSEKYSLWSFEFFINDAISVSYTLAITMALLFFKQWFEKERLAVRLEKLNVETELKYLKSQINPHFLFNSLNSIYALTLSKNDKAPEVILQLSEILRYILYEGGEKTVKLKKEIDYIKNYLELEKVRFGERLDLTIEVHGDYSGKEISPMILLPFIENSFKHGVNSTVEKSFIHIKISVEKNVLLFEIENNKNAEHSNEPSLSSGIGINNVLKRLSLIYPEKYDIKLDDKGNTYKVKLILHL
ncbi:MAG: histidine kinase [Bacteroidetes bacterium]|nr:histidine kinase [Bacteroidota bacterium]